MYTHYLLIFLYEVWVEFLVNHFSRECSLVSGKCTQAVCSDRPLLKAILYLYLCIMSTSKPFFCVHAGETGDTPANPSDTLAIRSSKWFKM